jgi:hypothetical protein
MTNYSNYYSRPNAKFLFIKWFIVYALIVSASLVASYFGFFRLIYTSDISRLCTLIAVLFTGASLGAGKLSYDISKENISDLTITKRLMVLNFLAQTFVYLGLLGTIIGFCYMMRGTLNANVDVSQIIEQLKVGSSTKLYTTLSGIITSVLLQLQLLFIKLDLKTESSDFE